MEKIPSFCKDHDNLQTGLYLSTVQQGVSTFDLRMKTPNGGDYVSPKALHTIEHIIATILRNGPHKENIVYFGPMGCRTGFYLVVFGAYESNDVASLVKRLFEFARDFEGEIPGAKPEECGNYHDSDLAQAKWWARRYVADTLSVLDDAHTHYPALLD